MTEIRALEVGGTVAVAAVTGAGVVHEADLSGAWALIVQIGGPALVGYFSARITSERAIERIETKVDALGNELRQYYARKGPE